MRTLGETMRRTLCTLLGVALALPAAAGQIGTGADAQVRLTVEQDISTETARVGDVIRLRTRDSASFMGEVFPAGTPATGIIVRAKRAGRLRGGAELAVGQVAILAPNGTAVATADTITSVAPPAGHRPSDPKVKALILLGLVAGYAGAWIASHWSDSEDAVVRAGVGTGVAAVAAVTVLPRGADAKLDRGATITLAFKAAVR